MKKLLLILLCLTIIGFTPISSISINNSPNNQTWVLVMSNGTGYSNQSVTTRSSYPEDAIKSGFDDGKSVTSLN